AVDTRAAIEVPRPKPLPRLIAGTATRDAGKVRQFLDQALEEAIGERVVVKAIYNSYRLWRSETASTPATAEEFAGVLKAFCDERELSTEKDGGKLYCCGVLFKDSLPA